MAMERKLDCRGKACPIPVVETKKLLTVMRDGEAVEISVDNDIAVQNLAKMAAQKQLAVTSEKLADDHYVVTITAKAEPAEPQGAGEAGLLDSQKGAAVVVLSSDKMGEGDEKLGRALMKGFIYAMTEQDSLPQTVLIYNSGAKLAVEGSESLADLRLLADQGVEILTCGTCLNHYGLTEKLGVGSVTNMYAIVEKMNAATKVTRP
jgi:selenium metabolism protein YedF